MKLPLPAQPRRQLSPQRAKWWLAIIVLAAAVIRFSRLGFPPALTDEAFTFWRVSGTFGQMFDTLRLDAFVPLHYELVWVLTKLLGTDVWVMRLPSAICATLMPLAIYRLCRIMLSRRTAIVAALLAAASAYFSFYARDAKMYMPAWFLTTLATAAAMGFTRTGRRLSWLQFIFFGTAAVGVHALTLIPLALAPLACIGVAHQRPVRRILLTLAGLAMITIGPAIYYATFNRWFTVSGGLSGVPVATADEAPHDNGLMWVERWQIGLDAADTLAESLAAYTVGYEYQPDPVTPSKSGPWGTYEAEYVLKNALFLVIAAATVATINALFLRKRPTGNNRRPRLLWMTVILLAVPLYTFYLRSFKSLASPWEILDWRWTMLLIALVILLVARGSHRLSIRSISRAAILVAASLATLIAVWIAVRIAHAHAPRLADGTVVWNHLWMPRYAAIVAPMLIILLAVIFSAVPTRPLRWIFILLFVSANLITSIARIVFPTAWPDDLFARDAVATITQSDTLLTTNWLMPGGGNLILPMPAPHYEMVRAAKLDVDPPSFRRGNQWPYRPGWEVQALLSRVRAFPLSTATARVPQSPEYQRIIVWRRNAQPDTPPVDFPGYSRVDHQQFIIRHAWRWVVTRVIDRTEYRVNAVPSTHAAVNRGTDTRIDSSSRDDTTFASPRTADR